MKVLFLANIPSPYRVDFFNELGKKCDLTVTFEGIKATDRNMEWKSDIPKNFKAIYLKGKRIKSDSFFCPGIIGVLKKKWDRIIIGVYSTTTSMLAIEYLKFSKKPFYIEADGGIIQKDKILKYKIKRHFISSASEWICSGTKTMDYLVYYGAERKQCNLFSFSSLTKQDLNNAVNMLKRGKKIYKNAIGIKEKKMILTVGRFSYEKGYGKGYDTVMRAAEKIDNDVGIYIVGDNPTDEFLEWKRQKRLHHVHFVGFKTKEELASYYAAADLFVFMTRSDVWGLVINEAMSFGLPVITTDKCIAGLELVKNNINGFIISVNDERSLKDKIEYILDDEEIKQSFGKYSLQSIQNYSIENMANEHVNILRLMNN